MGKKSVFVALHHHTMPARPIIESHALSVSKVGRGTGWVQAAAQSLLTLPFDEAVSTFLAGAGTQARADRAWLLVYNREVTHFRNTHEWCRAGVTGFVESLQDVPVAMIAWLHHYLLRNEAVMINDAGRLPKSAAALRVELRRQGNRSVLCVPLFHAGKIWGCIGFDAVREARNWTRSVATELQHAGTLIPLAANPRPVADQPPSGGAKDEGWLYLHDGTGMRRVTLDSIVGVRAERDYTRVYLHGGQTHLELRPLQTWLSVLPANQFRRIHRSAIANLRQLVAIERDAAGRWSAEIAGLALKWPVGRNHRAALRSSLGI